jgi:hypothetical protein
VQLLWCKSSRQSTAVTAAAAAVVVVRGLPSEVSRWGGGLGTC